MAGFGADTAPLAFRDPLGFGADAFISAVRQGAEPIVTGADGRNALDWARRIEDAAGIGLAEAYEAPERLLA